MQQIPSHHPLAGAIKGQFIPRDGNVFVGGDYSQQEPRITAEASNDAILVDSFVSGKDIYSTLISNASKRPYETCTKEYYGKEHDKWEEKHSQLLEKLDTQLTKEEERVTLLKLEEHEQQRPINYRNRGKTLLLALMYGLGADSLAFQLGIPLEEAKELLVQLRESLGGVTEFENRLKAMVREKGYLTTIGGRRRRFPNYALPQYTFLGNTRHISANNIKALDTALHGVWQFNQRKEVISAFSQRLNTTIVDNYTKRNEDSTKILNSFVQGTAALMSKLAMIFVDKRIENEPSLKGKAWVVLAIHDEILIEAPADQQDLAVRVVEEEMERAAKVFVKNISFKVSADVMTEWQKGD